MKTLKPMFCWGLCFALFGSLSFSLPLRAERGRFAQENDQEGGSGGNQEPAYVSHLPAAAAIVILTQPVATATTEGHTATFTVSASTTSDSITYQWYRKRNSLGETIYTAISGATESSYTTATLTADDAASYYFVRMTSAGTIMDSNRVLLVVNPAITITSQPVAAKRVIGQTATFTVSASTSSGTIAYQWYLKRNSQGETTYTAIPGATETSYTTAALTAGDAASYYFVRMTDAGTTVDSNRVLLVVNPAISITSQPEAAKKLIGQTATFSVSASTNAGTITYQWYLKRNSLGETTYTAISGATETSYTTAALTADDAASYYFVRMTNAGTTVDSNRVLLLVNPAVAIISQPVAVSMEIGQTASFSVTATSNGGSIAYQWYCIRKTLGETVYTAIPGATGSSCTTAILAATDDNSYYFVRLTDGGTVVDSSRVALRVVPVNAPPVITQQPVSQTLLPGQPLTLTVAANIEGGGTIGYQWRKDGVPLPGAVAASYSVTSISESDAGSYDVLLVHTLSGTTATALSAPALVAINVPPVINSQPTTQTVDQGQDASFSVAASVDAGGTPLYQWRKDGIPLADATQSQLSLLHVSAGSAGSYDVVVSHVLNGTTASNTSQAALLKVNAPPTILVQPQSQTVLPPDAVTFTVSAQAINGGSLVYVWKKNGAVIAGASSAAYTVPTTEFATNPDAYSVTVSEGSQSTESETVYARAAVTVQTYAGDPIGLPSRAITVLPSYHADPVNFPGGAFRLGYDEALKNPVWTAYVNFPVNAPYPNSNADYTQDPRLAAPRVGKNDYTGIYTGGASHADSYDRGHQVPRADVSYRYTTVAGDDATIMSNLVPQISQFNQQTWQKLEDAIGGTQGGSTDGLTSFKGRVWVYTGSVFSGTPRWWNSQVTPGLEIAIPEACYKIVVHETSPGHPEVLAVLMPNAWGLVNSTATLTGYVTSVARIENLTGLDFFPDLATTAPGLDIPTWKATVDVRGWRVPFEQTDRPNVHMLQPSYDTTVDLGTTITFVGAATPSAGVASGTTLATTTWNFGDASPLTNGASASHNYATSGSYSVTFTAMDSLGSSNTLTRVIRVVPPGSSNTAPTTTPALLTDQSSTTGQSVTVNFTVADDRTPAGSVAVTASSNNAVLLPDAGIAVSNTEGAIALVLTPVADQNGTATVTVTLTDGDGSIATRTFRFTVNAQTSRVLLEGFETGSKTAYATGNVTFTSGVWTLTDALVGNSASDRKSGLQSLRVRNGKVAMTFDWPSGAQTVTVNHAKYGTDADSTWELWYSTDAGTSWILAGPAVVSNTTTLTPATFNLNVMGPVRFEFRKTIGGTTRFNLDDFQIAGF